MTTENEPSESEESVPWYKREVTLGQLLLGVIGVLAVPVVFLFLVFSLGF